MRDHHIDLCGQIDFTRTEAMPLLARDAHFSFACNGCGDCCRGREDIVLSGFDLWRIAAGCACRRRSWRGDIAGPALAR